MNGLANYRLDQDGSGNTLLTLSGPYLVSTIGAIDAELRALEGPIARIELSDVSEIDTVGAWIAGNLASQHQAEISGATPRAERLLKALEGMSGEERMVPEMLPVWERVPLAMGEKVFAARDGIMGVLSFLGAIISATAHLARHPRRFRILALVHQLELVGVTALPIIGLMSFLIGIVIAQQGAVQLAQFGAETLTVNLVGRITLRELGVLMTAIMVAGRSGSAFAAQIGTMKLTEEVDAMRTIGISPVEALVIPRILAAVIMMPLLGFYSAGMGIIGGAVIGDLMLNIPFWTFLVRIHDVVPLHDLWVGLLKAPVFGLIVALAGCYHGMQVKGNSEQVGLRTTMAVVSAIFAVIVLDAIFAVFFTEIGWG
ncbi:MlaE family ABC transporter permease [Erythrobacter mangrovi]|uniref:ABC transporter permease n=1 Tax=Erythrobacter mangrovi TaxID=2739433 RepID=A0A7D4B8A9_9SPHN|nr:ABC transporter permease [Erythrobacter mangrovi]QKG70221.1 ABC transporter permease [Erythrobacter mangrovi]